MALNAIDATVPWRILNTSLGMQKKQKQLGEGLIEWVNKTFNLKMEVDPQALLFSLLDNTDVYSTIYLMW